MSVNHGDMFPCHNCSSKNFEFIRQLEKTEFSPHYEDYDLLYSIESKYLDCNNKFVDGI